MTTAQTVLDAEALDTHAAVWTVLHAGFGAAPPGEFTRRMRDAAELADWPLVDPRSREGVELLVSSATAGETQAEIVAEHHRLLRGPERLPVPPWESVHRSNEHLVFEAETLQVRAFYRRYGLRVERLNQEPDDHVALECAFLAELCVRALQVLEQGGDPTHFVDGYRRFVAEHAGQWFPRFFDGIAEHAGTRYHRGLAGLGAGAITAALATV